MRRASFGQRTWQQTIVSLSSVSQVVAKLSTIGVLSTVGVLSVFMLTAADRTPLLSPWVEALMSKATDNFKNDAYVKTYYETAKQNEAIMNGMAEPSGAPQTAPQAPLPQTPTPNQLAQPPDSAQ